MPVKLKWLIKKFKEFIRGISKKPGLIKKIGKVYEEENGGSERLCCS